MPKQRSCHIRCSQQHWTSWNTSLGCGTVYKRHDLFSLQQKTDFWIVAVHNWQNDQLDLLFSGEEQIYRHHPQGGCQLARNHIGLLLWQLFQWYHAHYWEQLLPGEPNRYPAHNYLVGRLQTRCRPNWLCLLRHLL
jgi:hypothetical protein